MRISRKCKIFSQDTLFPRKINLKIYQSRVRNVFLTKHVRTLFPRKWCPKRKNFILHFRLIFTRRTTSCRLFSTAQSGTSHIQVYLINFQIRFFRKLNFYCTFCSYFFHKESPYFRLYMLFGRIL